MRVLVTGANGFVGRHLCTYLAEQGDEPVAVAGRTVEQTVEHPQSALAVDVRDLASLSDLVSAKRPDAVVHLAAVSSVAQSHREPRTTFDINVMGTLNLCIAARDAPTRPRVLFVSSGEVYGAVPLGTRADESSPPRPMSPYAASKVSGETVTMQFARAYGLEAVCARPFSHVGAGQDTNFVLPSFAQQIARAQRYARRAALSVGDLSPVRDFSHVKDVVAAYRLLLMQGRTGETYNICSGEGHSIRSMLDALLELAGVEADIGVDPSKVRPVEIPCLIGDPSKLQALGWRPTHTLDDALREILAEATGRSQSA